MTEEMGAQESFLERRDWFFMHEKRFVNGRAKMKERRQNYRKIRVLDDNITENTNERFPLTCRNFARNCCLHAKPKSVRKETHVHSLYIFLIREYLQ